MFLLKWQFMWNFMVIMVKMFIMQVWPSWWSTGSYQ
jgi:hypothetical protein